MTALQVLQARGVELAGCSGGRRPQHQQQQTTSRPALSIERQLGQEHKQAPGRRPLTLDHRVACVASQLDRCADGPPLTLALTELTPLM